MTVAVKVVGQSEIVYSGLESRVDGQVASVM